MTFMVRQYTALRETDFRSMIMKPQRTQGVEVSTDFRILCGFCGFIISKQGGLSNE